MVMDTKSACSTVPLAYFRLGVEAGGSDYPLMHPTYFRKVLCGVVQMELVARAFPGGYDETGQRKWSYTPLPEKLLQKVKNPNPTIIAKIEGAVPRIGLNVMKEWGLKIDPSEGFVA